MIRSMLDPWIIEEIKRRERDQAREIQLPVEQPEPESIPATPSNDTPERGVAVIDLAS
jgi:hypothetical protein